jgi:C1A family cysteine protease
MFFGWLKDPPDIRDYGLWTGRIAGLARPKLRAETGARADLRRFCSPVEDQGQLGSCTANAASGMAEYFEKKSFGRYCDASRLFIYKVTRNLMKVTGDTGAYLRSTMKALSHFGAAPEEYWPYDVKRFDAEPGAFVYAYGGNFRAMEYSRVDLAEKKPAEVLADLKALLSNNLAFIFGFMVYSSVEEASATGLIPFPSKKEKLLGGHAVMAAGYDDGLTIGKSRGAFLIRNSWGPGWGQSGYGWLPYDFVLKGLAADFWTLMKLEYIDSALFED